MKGLLISAFATASLFMGVSTVAISPASAGGPPKCIDYHDYHYCLADYYKDDCIYYEYDYHKYVYCRVYDYNKSYGGGNSGY